MGTVYSSNAATGAGVVNPTVNEREGAEGRSKGLQMYKILAVVDLLLAIGLLTCAGLGVQHSSADTFGPPYYIGGFVAGAMLAFGFLAASCVVHKARANETSVVTKGEVACAITGHQILSTFTFMGCFIGFVLLGVSGAVQGEADCTGSRFSRFSDSCDANGTNKSVAIALVVLLICAFIAAITGMYVICTYGRFFGVVIQGRRRGQPMVVVMNNTGTTAIPMGNTPVTGNADLVEQLRRQNELLQQQLELQRQQQGAQFNQTQYSQFNQYPNAPPPNYGIAVNFQQPQPQPQPQTYMSPDAPPPPYPEKDSSLS